MSDEVVLRGYPVRLGLEQQEHLDGVLREFQLIALSSSPSTRAVPDRLRSLVDQITATYAVELAEPERLREQAMREGRATVDLRCPVRPETAEVVQAWSAVLDEVDAYARTDDLLVLARPPQVVALQQWVLGEFLAQLAGQEPTAWPGPV